MKIDSNTDCHQTESKKKSIFEKDTSLDVQEENYKVVLHQDQGRPLKKFVTKFSSGTQRQTTATQIRENDLVAAVKKASRHDKRVRETLNIQAKINGTPTKVLLDSGAKVNVVDEDYLMNVLKYQSTIQRCDQNLNPANTP